MRDSRPSTPVLILTAFVLIVPFCHWGTAEDAVVVEKYTRNPTDAYFIEAKIGKGVWLKNRHPAVFPVPFRTASVDAGTVSLWMKPVYVSDWPSQRTAIAIDGLFAAGNFWDKRRQACYLVLPGAQLAIDRAFCGTFHHVLHTWYTDEERTYLDGELVSTGKRRDADLKKPESFLLRIAARQGMGIDEVVVLDRSATTDDVAHLASGTRAWTLDGDTVLHAPFDGTLEARSHITDNGDVLRMFVHVGRPSATFLANDKPGFTVRVLNATSEARELTLKTTVTDLNRSVVFEKSLPVAAAAGTLCDVPLDLADIKTKGLFWGTFELFENGERLQETRIPFATTFGVNPALFAAEEMHTGYYLACPFPLLAAQKWVVLKESSSWSRLEPKQGQWHFDQLDHTVNAYLASGRVPVFPLGRGAPKWYTDRFQSKGAYYGYYFPNADSSEGLRVWLDSVRTIVARYRGKIRDYEFFPEYYGRTNAKYYVRVFNATAKAIHEVDAGIRVASTLGGYESWRKVVVPAIAANADYFTLHPYGMSHAEMRGDEHYRRWVDMLEECGASTALAGTESGCWHALKWAVADDGRPLSKRQFDRVVEQTEMPAFFTKRGRGRFVDFFTGAARIVRQQVQCRSLGFMYDLWWSDAGGGMIADVSYHPHTPSLMSVAYTNVSGLLAGWEYVRKIDLGATYLRGYLFKRGNEFQLVVMTDDPDEPTAVFPQLGESAAEVLDLYGNPVPFGKEDGFLKLALQPLLPLYVRHLTSAPERNRPVLSIETGTDAYPGMKTGVVVHAYNPTSRPLSATLTLTAPELLKAPQTRSLTLKPKGAARVEIDIVVPESIINSQPVHARLDTDSACLGALSRRGTLMIRRAVIASEGNVTVDGALDEWGDPKDFRIVLDDDDQVIKGIPYTRMYAMNQHVDWTGREDLSARVSVRHDQNRIYVAVRGYDNVLMSRFVDNPIYVYMDDSVEIFIDGRSRDKLGSPEFVGTGVYHIKLAPKIGDQDCVSYVSKPRGLTIPGLACASKQLADGYSLELMIPKKAFPGFAFSARSEMGFMVQIADQDTVMHGHAGAKSVLNWTGTRGVAHDPSKFSTLILE